MLDQLINVPGFLKQLKDRLTQLWVDNMAALYTALINRAPLLDKLNISGNVAGSAELAALSVVRSIQTGYVFGSASTGAGEDAEYIDVTISAVNTAKSIVLLQSSNVQGAGNAIGCTARLTSSTNVRISNRNAADTPGGRWTVLEFK